MKKKVFAISLPHHPFSSFRPLPMQLLVLVMSVPSFPFRKCLLKLSCLFRQLSLGLSAESLLLCLLPMTHSAPLYNFTHILIYFFSAFSASLVRLPARQRRRLSPSCAPVTRKSRRRGCIFASACGDDHTGLLTRAARGTRLCLRRGLDDRRQRRSDPRTGQVRQRPNSLDTHHDRTFSPDPL